MDVHWVVTEHGAVCLKGKSEAERAEALISIAAPHFRDQLRYRGGAGPMSGVVVRRPMNGEVQMQTAEAVKSEHRDVRRWSKCGGTSA